MYKIIILLLFFLFLAFYFIKRGSSIQRTQKESPVKIKRGVGDLLLALGALFIVSPILASFIATLYAILVKMDAVLGFVWGMIFAMTVAPLGFLLVIIGFIINLFSKEEEPITNPTNPTATPTTGN